jgi:acyl-CoA oxidase
LQAAWLAATDEVYDSSRSFQDSAAGLRQLIKTGLLTHTDLRDHPERFFKAHRLLARHAVKHGPGFWIRFTVHYNLCFGTVLAVGSPEQVDSMETVQAHGLLGCFALTEKLAGVQSGLIVQTKAEYDASSETFRLSNIGATEGAYKNWISQGFVADKAVVLADLTVGGERKGPHAFLMDMRKGTCGLAAAWQRLAPPHGCLRHGPASAVWSAFAVHSLTPPRVTHPRALSLCAQTASWSRA